ncbi:ATP-binding cassette domain-containing protein [Flammeovirga yaeyamensis]|uniref:ATP-binding cassette domain-containing protein n=1 Tax=Flammeovirga yaeyamensis TaxID=367791 RepID=A0AAX1N0V6_9BACT|nr:ABC transporter ATP-binding protein [Flammeovirga yaeyamensis]MBB3698421.1 putative ABC transport system ATP-binding protein [Flammeovirga yaeyamensis]NMF34229.1 ABC transporter ATP-binding protein [Flammeovirga yaeyamensis]QWG01213.1 ATP-binding cassette domain-containing protein [Flammeovirga yaeyamensis]
MIEIKDIVKTYNENTVPVHALNHVNLRIEEGEFTAVVGPSGCGKTTFLNILGGLDTPTSGNILIDGTNLHDRSSADMITYRRDHIGFVFQDYSLMPVLTAKENVEFIMELQGRPKEERAARSKELLEAVGIGDKGDQFPTKLSGGQQQRVAVARALASKPNLILADEPTANLDSKSTADLLDIMRSLNEKENITFVIATHDQRVMDRAKRVITFEDGKIIDMK